MCLTASVILASNVKILVSFEAILIYSKAYGWIIAFKKKIASTKLSSIVPILASITFADEYIFLSIN